MRQAGRQDISGNVHVVRPGFLLALTTWLGEIGQPVDRVGFLASQGVCVETHCQVDIAVSHVLLHNPRMDKGRCHQGSGGVSEAVEIGIASCIVLVRYPSGFQVWLEHIRRFVRHLECLGIRQLSCQ
ncbi:MAG: hypothetical protein ABIF19_12915 [Planctomycetota bacterium]